MYDLAQNNAELPESKVGTCYISQTPFQLIEQKKCNVYILLAVHGECYFNI